MSYFDEVFVRKYIREDRLDSLIEEIKAGRKTISFTNGCFDILHPGHLELLYFCKGLADILIIGLNSDDSIKKIKGPKRPVFDLEQRMQMLAGYSFVDFLASFDEKDPAEIIRRIRPDYLVKGTDWGHGRIIGEDFVKSYGGNVVAFPLKGVNSTSGIIEMILDRFSGKDD